MNNHSAVTVLFNVTLVFCSLNKGLTILDEGDCILTYFIDIMAEVRLRCI